MAGAGKYSILLVRSDGLGNPTPAGLVNHWLLCYGSGSVVHRAPPALWQFGDPSPRHNDLCGQCAVTEFLMATGLLPLQHTADVVDGWMYATGNEIPPLGETDAAQLAAAVEHFGGLTTWGQRSLDQALADVGGPGTVYVVNSGSGRAASYSEQAFGSFYAGWSVTCWSPVPEPAPAPPLQEPIEVDLLPSLRALRPDGNWDHYVGRPSTTPGAFNLDHYIADDAHNVLVMAPEDLPGLWFTVDLAGYIDPTGAVVDPSTTPPSGSTAFVRGTGTAQGNVYALTIKAGAGQVWTMTTMPGSRHP